MVEDAGERGRVDLSDHGPDGRRRFRETGLPVDKSHLAEEIPRLNIPDRFLLAAAPGLGNYH